MTRQELSRAKRAGAAAGYMAVTAMYPDVARRMLRDSSRAMRSGKRMVSNMFR